MVGYRICSYAAFDSWNDQLGLRDCGASFDCSRCHDLEACVTCDGCTQYAHGNFICGAVRDCLAEQSLPSGYGFGQHESLSIMVFPPTATLNWALEDIPPSGWSVPNITPHGVYSAVNHQVKWGPYFDNQETVLSYSATPPVGTTGTKAFSGVLSVDGSNQPICGDLSIAPGTFHPADLSDDWRLVVSEVTAYGAAWQPDDSWPRPTVPIPITHVTNAGDLWKSGEVYHYEGNTSPPWVTGAAAKILGDASSSGPRETKAASCSAKSSFDPSSYTPGQGVVVTIDVIPETGTNACALKDGPPTGWVISNINNGGVYGSVSRMVKWGPFFDDQARALQYTATPPAPEAGTKTFAGTYSADGSNETICGARTITDETTANEFADGFESGNTAEWSSAVGLP